MSIVNFDWDEMDVINTLKIREATERAIKTDSNGVKRVILSFDIEHIFDQRAKEREAQAEEWRDAHQREVDSLVSYIESEKADLCCDGTYSLTFGQRLRIWLRNLRNF